ncbi:hypothetical protein CJ030_MR0G006971 [Morella rubra]|uniref:Uncharacterized protein n=1 Tax=Morella rubra TaxID=262757 RepID=A0A6A1UJW7_9ROSI|nr:hypothetical protein CJ030_MR0G006971 [Morella rubra]
MIRSPLADLTGKSSSLGQAFYMASCCAFSSFSDLFGVPPARREARSRPFWPPKKDMRATAGQIRHRALFPYRFRVDEAARVPHVLGFHDRDRDRNIQVNAWEKLRSVRCRRKRTHPRFEIIV